MRKLLLVLWLGAGLGCQHLGFASEACSGAVARDRLPGESSLHVRALLTHEGVTQRHEAIVQISDRAVTLLGLTPLGTQAYRLTLDENGLDLDKGVSGHLGLDPRLAFDAIARAWIAPRGRAPVEVGLEASGERLLPGAESGAWRYVDASSRMRARVDAEAEAVHVVSDLCGYDARLVLLTR